MRHLDASTLEEILCGSLSPDQARGIASHLRAGCPQCEELIDQELDLETLLSLLEAEQADPEEPAQKEKIWAGVDHAAKKPAANSNRIWLAAGAFAALAASALLVINIPDDYTGTKGVAAPAVKLSVSAGHQSHGFELDRDLSSGDRIGETDVLFFELSLSKPGARYLFAVDGDEELTMLEPLVGQASKYPAGNLEVGSGTDRLFLTLEDLKSPLKLVAAASSEPMDSKDVVQCWLDSKPCELAYDYFELSW